jgi:hypothetical protein
MAEQLPPDLSRLGDEIDRATARRFRERKRRAERRRRVAVTAAAAVLAVVVLGPGALQPGIHRSGSETAFASTRTGYQPTACDQPRGATFAAVRPCASPGATDVAPDLLARRYAVQ